MRGTNRPASAMMATLSAVTPAMSLISVRDTNSPRVCFVWGIVCVLRARQPASTRITAGAGFRRNMRPSARQRRPLLAPLFLPDDLMRRDRGLGFEEVVARPAFRRIIARRQRAAHRR